MKNAIFFSAIIIIALFGFQTSLSAQKTATWKGGTPGRANSWNCPGNWKEGRVPNEFSNVIIPDVSTSTFSNPVLKEGTVEILSLQINPGATLVIGKNAKLIANEQDGSEITAWIEGTLTHDLNSDNLFLIANDGGQDRLVQK